MSALLANLKERLCNVGQVAFNFLLPSRIPDPQDKDFMNYGTAGIIEVDKRSKGHPLLEKHNVLASEWNLLK